MRTVEHRYEDPLEVVWLACAARMGLRITRSREVYAATDGKGGLTIGERDTLDADDCLAQMIFHELCHALVAGPAAFDAPDWGMSNQDARDLSEEHACLRTQATLAQRFGLRDVLAPTTEHRAFYDGLGRDPLEGDDPAVQKARRAVARATQRPWDPHLSSALRASHAIVSAVAPHADEGSLFRAIALPLDPHSVAGHVHPSPRGRRCEDCGFRRGAGCLQFPGAAVRAGEVACHRHEPPPRCETCGACCRDAYDSVELEADDPFLARHEALVERVDGRIVLARPGGRCPPLRGDGTPNEPFRCAIYEERPSTCRDFERGSENCLDARRRLGLSQ